MIAAVVMGRKFEVVGMQSRKREVVCSCWGVRRSGKAGALPHRGTLKAVPKTVAVGPDTEDDFASIEEIVVDMQGVVAVLCRSEQRVSNGRALGVFVLVSVSSKCIA